MVFFVLPREPLPDGKRWSRKWIRPNNRVKEIPSRAKLTLKASSREASDSTCGRYQNAHALAEPRYFVAGGSTLVGAPRVIRFHYCGVQALGSAPAANEFVQCAQHSKSNEMTCSHLPRCWTRNLRSIAQRFEMPLSLVRAATLQTQKCHR